MKQAKVLTTSELKRVLAVIECGHHAKRNRVAILISHYAGLRVGEIAKLKIADVLSSEGTIAEQFPLSSAYTKGGISRTIFVNRKLNREIAQYLSWLQTRKRNAKNLPLIQSQKGGAFSANSLCQMFKKIYELAGIVGASSHSGRRHFITALAHSGVSSKVIMELAGHKHLTTTQRYIDVTDNMKASAVELI